MDVTAQDIEPVATQAVSWYIQAHMKKLGIFILLLALSGCLSSKNSDKSKILARFDGSSITEKQFLKKVEALPKTVPIASLERKKDLIESMASEHFLLKEAVKQRLDQEPDVKELMEAARKKILIAKLIEKEVDKKIRVTGDEIAKYYEFHKEEFMTPLLLRASHILVKTEEEAISIKTALDAGADFEETARQKSTDATAIRGGDLGFFQKRQFVPEFERVAFGLKKGEISEPVKTAFGYHVIRLNDRIEPRLRELKSVRAMVEERLVLEKRSSAFKEFVQKLRGNAKVQVDEKELQSVLEGSL